VAHLLEKLERVDRRIIFLVLALALIIPLFAPIGLPLTISPPTRAFYEVMESLPEGSILWFGCEYSPGASGELNPQLAAVFRHAMSRNLRVILFSLWQDGPVLARSVVDPIAEEMGKVYGVDYVNLGYKPGGVSALRTILHDVWAGCANVDIDGTALSELPLMSEVRAIDPDTIKAVIVFSSGSPGDGDYLTYWTESLGIILMSGQVAVQVPTRMPQLQSGQQKGLIPGLSGAAEYETLMGKPSTATQLMDCQSMAHLAIIIFLIIGNIGYLGTVFGKKGGKE